MTAVRDPSERVAAEKVLRLNVCGDALKWGGEHVVV